MKKRYLRENNLYTVVINHIKNELKGTPL
jgi:hypothetical protein